MRSLTTGQSTFRRPTQPSELDCGFDSTPSVNPSSMTTKGVMQNLTKAGAKGVLMCKIDVEGPPRDTLHARIGYQSPGNMPETCLLNQRAGRALGYFVNTQQLAAHSMVYGLWALSLRVNPLSGRPCILPTSQVKKRFPKALGHMFLRSPNACVWSTKAPLGEEQVLHVALEFLHLNTNARGGASLDTTRTRGEHKQEECFGVSVCCACVS